MPKKGKGRKVTSLRALPLPVRELVVELLERVLAMAKRGEVHGIVAVLVSPGQTVYEVMKGNAATLSAIGSLQCLTAKLVAVSNAAEEDGDVPPAG